MTRFYLDFETWSSVPIFRGTDVYLDNARPLLMTYAVDDYPAKVIDFTETPGYYPPIIDDPNIELWAHNAFFDRNVLLKCLDINTDISRWRCSQALAFSHSLPGNLGDLCRVLGVPQEQAKIADGKRLIRKFCCSKEFKKDAEWPLFVQYATNDVVAMRECVRRMPNCNYVGDEIKLWHLDQAINNRGFKVDRQLAEGAVKLLTSEKDRNDDWTNQATGGIVTAATQRDKMLMFLCEQQGCLLPDLKAATIKEALEDESLGEATRALLRVRLESSKTSGSKYKRLLSSLGKGDRLRGTLQFAGASRTARWSGRIFQPQNLPRPTMHLDDMRHCIELIRDSRTTSVSLFASANEACSNALRGLIVAEKGKRLLIADYSAIEGRINAWLAGEEWKVKAFHDGKDLYKLIYSKAFSIGIEQVTKFQRQNGKVMELACGYGGGVGAFINMAAAYGMDLEELGRTVKPVDKAREAWGRALSKNETFGLSEAAYLACDTLKIGYRQANPAITKSWCMYEDAVRKVITAAKAAHRIQVGHLMFDCDGNWMRIQLPSGRFLCYALPLIHNNGTISYMSWRNKQWSRTKMYGGKLCENIVQAISRDLLGWALLRIDRAGYPVVLHIHDEIVAETAAGSLSEFIKLMTELPKWAAGLPINAEGFEGTRYEKQ